MGFCEIHQHAFVRVCTPCKLDKVNALPSGAAQRRAWSALQDIEIDQARWCLSRADQTAGPLRISYQERAAAARRRALAYHQKGRAA